MSDSRVIQAGPQASSPDVAGGTGQPAPAPSSAEAGAGQAAQPADGGTKSQKIAALMAREAAAVRRELEAKTYEEKVKAKEEALAAREAKVQAFEDLWKKDPRKAVKERGLDPLQLALAQDDQPMTPEVQINLLRQEILAMREERRQERENAEKERNAKAQTDSAEEERQWKAEVSTFVETNKDKFPFLNAYNRVDLVMEAIEDHFDRTLKEAGKGEELSLEKASELTEAALRAEVKKGEELLRKVENPGSAVKPGTTPPGADRRNGIETSRWVEKPVKTLAGIQSTTPSSPQRFLSDQERAERAVQRLREIRARGQG